MRESRDWKFKLTSVTSRVSLTNEDLERLNPGKFLNDNLIESGLK